MTFELKVEEQLVLWLLWYEVSENEHICWCCGCHGVKFSNEQLCSGCGYSVKFEYILYVLTAVWEPNV